MLMLLFMLLMVWLLLLSFDFQNVFHIMSAVKFYWIKIWQDETEFHVFENIEIQRIKKKNPHISKVFFSSIKLN